MVQLAWQTACTNTKYNFPLSINSAPLCQGVRGFLSGSVRIREAKEWRAYGVFLGVICNKAGAGQDRNSQDQHRSNQADTTSVH